MGILSLLLWTPAVGVLLLAFTPWRNASLIRLIANLSASLAFLFACLLLSRYNPQAPALQFSEYFPVNPSLGSAYALGIDGLSIPMVMLATLLTLVASLSPLRISTGVKGYYICMLLLEFGMLGVFLAQDWVLFYIFWEVTLIPLFFLISRWGGKRRQAAGLNFAVYTMGGSVFMLISLLAISQYSLEHGNSLMTSMQQVIKSMPLQQQVWVLLGFVLGFGVKLPIFPLHGWLPLAHVEAPGQVSVLLSGILLKMAAYGLLRALVMLPAAARVLQPLLVLLALLGMLYGCLLAWRQSDLKAMIAYSSISFMSVVLLGIAGLNQAGINGAILQMTAHGLIAGALFLLADLLYERTHSRNIQDYGSFIQIMPKFTLLLILALFAAMGLPGFIGFIAQLHILIAFFQQWGWLWMFLGLNILITSSYTIRTISILFTGRLKPGMQALEDLRPVELLTAGVLVVLIVLLGLLPAPLINLSASTITRMSGLLNI